MFFGGKEFRFLVWNQLAIYFIRVWDVSFDLKMGEGGGWSFYLCNEGIGFDEASRELFELESFERKKTLERIKIPPHTSGAHSSPLNCSLHVSIASVCPLAQESTKKKNKKELLASQAEKNKSRANRNPFQNDN